MKTLETMVSELLADGLTPELAQKVAQRQYAAALATMEAVAEAERRAGIEEYCGLKFSGISYTDSNGVRVTHLNVKGAKCLEDGVIFEPAKVGQKDSEEKTPYYPPALWLCIAGKTPANISGNDCEGLVHLMNSRGQDAVIGVIRAAAAAMPAFRTEKAEGIKAGRYQDTDRKTFGKKKS